MRKTLVYAVVLVLLGAAVWYIISENRENIFGNAEASFSIKDTNAIGRIFLSRTNGETMTLDRTKDGWKVNGKYNVLQEPMSGLLKVLYKQVAEYPVPDVQHNRIIKALASNSIKVEIYNLGGERIKVFYVGEENAQFTGTYMLMEGAKHAYVVNVPGFDGILTPRYNPDITDWRDRMVFNIAADDITSISVQYPEQPLNSFIMRQEGDKLTVKLDSALKIAEPLNQDRVRSYLHFFQKLFCEGFINGLPGLDTTISQQPVRCIIDVTGKNGYVQHLRVFWRPLNKRSKNLATPMPNYPNQFDADKFFAVFNNNTDTAIIQSLHFDKLFRSGYEFYQYNTPLRVDDRDSQPTMIVTHPQ